MSAIIAGAIGASALAFVLHTFAGAIGPPDAERRVAEVIARAQENIARARATVVILGFMVGAAALLGAVAAWFASCAGGRQRDGRETLHPLWDWSPAG
jgi:hypothetical protein